MYTYTDIHIYIYLPISKKRREVTYNDKSLRNNSIHSSSCRNVYKVAYVRSKGREEHSEGPLLQEYRLRKRQQLIQNPTLSFLAAKGKRKMWFSQLSFLVQAHIPVKCLTLRTRVICHCLIGEG